MAFANEYMDRRRLVKTARDGFNLDLEFKGGTQVFHMESPRDASHSTQPLLACLIKHRDCMEIAVKTLAGVQYENSRNPSISPRDPTRRSSSRQPVNVESIRCIESIGPVRSFYVTPARTLGKQKGKWSGV